MGMGGNSHLILSHEDDDLQNQPSCDSGQHLVKNCPGCLCQTGYSVAVHVRSAIGCAHVNGSQRKKGGVTCALRETGRKNGPLIDFSVRRRDAIARRLPVKVIRRVLFVTGGGISDVSGRRRRKY